MADRTILDLYRHELERPRAGHYTHVVPGGSTAYDTEGFFSRTAAIADGLAALGIAAGDRVLVLCDNRPEWHMVDLAVLDLGAVNVAVYGTLTGDQLAYQAADSGARLAVVENAEQAVKVLEIRARCPELRQGLCPRRLCGFPGPLRVVRFLLHNPPGRLRVHQPRHREPGMLRRRLCRRLYRPLQCSRARLLRSLLCPQPCPPMQGRHNHPDWLISPRSLRLRPLPSRWMRSVSP